MTRKQILCNHHRLNCIVQYLKEMQENNAEIMSVGEILRVSETEGCSDGMCLHVTSKGIRYSAWCESNSSLEF